VTQRPVNFGTDLTKPHVVIVTAALTERRLQIRATFRRYAERAGGLSGEIGGHLVSILPIAGHNADAYLMATEIAKTFADDGTPLAVGASSHICPHLR
jgi:hypothetical protein